ncbi:MAG: hypothetical protein FRX48_05812 [Lasallia pustulata]|uniref:DUF1742-domain-containing protein n=1 Tax=Lasallia pustulata TaxID=136370 RepID=A0A5M8PLN5_9LECA|nr:MAG: hypothetical protein FRX48_05812 [Lasallia pustulata]
MSLTNIWHLRKVAETSSKACYVCYKPTTSVLVTPDNKDHFYVCPGHLKDRGFCSPIIDEAEAVAKRKKEEMDREIELIKKEYDEKVKKKKIKDKKSKEKEDEKKKEEEEAKQAEQEKNEKIKSLTSKEDASPVDNIPRIYALHKNLYQMRLDRIRNSETARRNRERLRNPTLFPSVPKTDL